MNRRAPVHTLWAYGLVFALLCLSVEAALKAPKKSKVEQERKTVKMCKQALAEGDPLRAIRMLEAHHNANPNHATPESLWVLGRALKSINKLSEAKEAFEKAYEKTKATKKTPTAELDHDYALVLYTLLPPEGKRGIDATRDVINLLQRSIKTAEKGSVRSSSSVKGTIGSLGITLEIIDESLRIMLEMYNGRAEFVVEDLLWLERIATDYNLPDLHWQGAMVAMQLKEHEAAHMFLDKAAKKPEWYSKKGHLYIEAEDWANALTTYQEALRTNRKAPPAMREHWYKEASDAYLRSGYLQAGIAITEECIAEMPNPSTCWFGRGVIAMHLSAAEVNDDESPAEVTRKYLNIAKDSQRKAWEIALERQDFPLPSKDCKSWKVWVDYKPDYNPLPADGGEAKINTTTFYTPSRSHSHRGFTTYGQERPRIWDHRKNEELSELNTKAFKAMSDGKLKRLRTEFSDRPIAIHKVEKAVVQYGPKLVSHQPSVTANARNGVCMAYLFNYIEAGFAYAPATETVNRPILQVPRAALFHWLDANYYHWTVEVLSKIVLLFQHLESQRIPTDSVKLIVPSTEGFHGQSLRWLGIPPSSLLVYNPSRHQYHVDELYVVSWQDNKDEVETPFLPPPHALKILREHMAPKLYGIPNRIRDKVIYVSRGDASSRRGVKNQDALIKALEVEVRNAGKTLVVHTGGGQTFEQQAQLFAEAVVVIGPHGAGFSNAVWAPPGTVIVEFPLTAERPFFAHLAAALNFSYWVVPEIHSDPWGQYDVPVAGIDRAAATLRHILSEINQKKETIVTFDSALMGTATTTFTRT